LETWGEAFLEKGSQVPNGEVVKYLEPRWTLFSAFDLLHLLHLLERLRKGVTFWKKGARNLV
jgi:hypothetical protein